MLRFAFRRAVAALLTLFGVLALVFAILNAVPGDPATLAARSGGMRGGSISAEALRSFRAAYGLDRPPPIRFVLLLPVATLALSELAFLARFIRGCLVEALRAPSSDAARARGAGEREVIARALRRSAVPFAAMGAALVPGVVTGSVLVERLFSIP